MTYLVRFSMTKFIRLTTLSAFTLAFGLTQTTPARAEPTRNDLLEQSQRQRLVKLLSVRDQGLTSNKMASNLLVTLGLFGRSSSASGSLATPAALATSNQGLGLNRVTFNRLGRVARRLGSPGISAAAFGGSIFFEKKAAILTQYRGERNSLRATEFGQIAELRNEFRSGLISGRDFRRQFRQLRILFRSDLRLLAIELRITLRALRRDPVNGPSSLIRI